MRLQPTTLGLAPSQSGRQSRHHEVRTRAHGRFLLSRRPALAVCVQPGTELAFEREIESQAAFRLFPPRKLGASVARFRRVNEGVPHMHHDALELPGGQTVLLTSLREGQQATVIQLPATERQQQPAPETLKSIVA